MENNLESRWVRDRLATLEPSWTPNSVRARALLEQKQRPATPRKIWMAAATAVALLAILVTLPQSRALAQNLWDRLFLNHVEITRLDLSKLPLDTRITTNGFSSNLRDAEQARQLAGFTPNLPKEGTPQWSVIGPITLHQTILSKSGNLPVDWEGIQLQTEIGPMIVATYPDGSQILQGQPIALRVPTSFPLELFVETAFRSIGATQAEAKLLGRNFAANPAWFLDIPSDKAVSIQALSIQASPALLLEEFDGQGTLKEATVLYSTPDRIYLVRSRTRQQSIRLANSL
ncbi:hypothetical protein [Bryobacter aggregatus]|uniref:hypothetical protein n=1 Tax=Bryobacter aggregatus TaxID=360054 RepID=UPI0004E161B2|nr:hypothetical protein [Bryobacter aggregatus]